MRTPSQTAGPFVSIGTAWNVGGPVADGVSLSGCVRDGSGALVTDALLEFWSASSGRFARALTGDDGCFQIAVARDGQHLDVSILARGLMQRLVTRIYLSTEEDELDPAVRHALTAREQTPDHYVFDIHLQGDLETVFFLPWPS